MPLIPSFWPPSWISGEGHKVACILLTWTNRVSNANVERIGTTNIYKHYNYVTSYVTSKRLIVSHTCNHCKIIAGFSKIFQKRTQVDKIYAYIASVLNKAHSKTITCFLPPSHSSKHVVSQTFNSFSPWCESVSSAPWSMADECITSGFSDSKLTQYRDIFSWTTLNRPAVILECTVTGSGTSFCSDGGP